MPGCACRAKWSFGASICMADNGIRLYFDLSAFPTVTHEVIRRAMPAVRAAVERIADTTAMNWKRAVDNAGLWKAEREAYRDSIHWRMTGPLSAEVLTDYDKAQEIEEGRPARDLKRMLQTSLKVRMSKKGERFLIIPFRHNVPSPRNSGQPGVMPDAVHSQAVTLQPSRIIGQTWRSSGTGAWGAKSHRPIMVMQAHYKWGDALPAGLAPKLKSHHATDPYHGMVRMDHSSHLARSSAYLTFRVMRESSQGWVVAPKPGLFLTREVSQGIQPLAEKAINAAIAKSLAG